MAIFICSECGHTEETPEEYIGKKARCLSCQTMGIVQAKPPAPPRQSPQPVVKESSAAPPPQDFVKEETPTPPAPASTSRSNSLTFVLIGLVAAILVIQLLSIQLNMPASAQWEYKIVSPKDSVIIEELDDLGERGWEVVTARRASGYNDSYSYEMILKRAK